MNTCNECAARDREIARQRKEAARWKDRAATYKKQASTQHQTKAQDRLDAKRYRWLKNGNTDSQITVRGWNLHGADLDTEIDAAMLNTPNAKAVGLDAAGGQSHTSDGLCPGD